MRSSLRPLLLAVPFALGWTVPPAMAEVRRCVTPSGQTIFTDRKCGDVGAAERVPHATGTATRVYRGGCARNLQDLVYEISTAIDAQVRRYSGCYFIRL